MIWNSLKESKSVRVLPAQNPHIAKCLTPNFDLPPSSSTYPHRTKCGISGARHPKSVRLFPSEISIYASPLLSLSLSSQWDVSFERPPVVINRDLCCGSMPTARALISVRVHASNCCEVLESWYIVSRRFCFRDYKWSCPLTNTSREPTEWCRRTRVSRKLKAINLPVRGALRRRMAGAKHFLICRGAKHHED